MKELSIRYNISQAIIRKFLTQQEGRYAGTPKRTLSGGQFMDGYSDHYPTYIILSK